MTAYRGKCIALIGLRGCGKTTVGRELATLLCGECVDTDDMIVKRAGRSIAEIFATESEAGFRRRESEAILEIVKKPPAVISVGGGAVLHQENIKELQVVATAVWLTAPAETLFQRISTDPATLHSRPSLTALSGIEEVRQLLVERTPFYSRVADFQINTDGLEPKVIAEQIIKLLGPPSTPQPTA